MFTHLHVHSHYSLLEAIGSPKAYLEQVKNLGMETMTLTDYGGMYGVVEFYKEAKKQGIKPILGVELGYVTDMHRKDPGEHAGMIVLLAKNYAGYQNLLQLVSAAHLQGFHGIPRIDAACLREWGGDLIAISGGERSRLGKAQMNAVAEGIIRDQWQQLEEIIGKEDCFVSWVVQDQHGGKMQVLNEALRSFAQQQGCGLIVSGDVHYVHAKDQEIFETALAIKDGKRIYDTDRRLAPRAMHLQSESEMSSWLAKAGWNDQEIQYSFEQIQSIVESIDIQIPMDTILFPVYESPEDIKAGFEKAKNQLIV